MSARLFAARSRRGVPSLHGLALLALAWQTPIEVPPCPNPFDGVQSDEGSFACSPLQASGLPFSGSYGRTVAGDVDGDRVAEVATLKGTTLIVFRAPAITHEAYAESNVLDVCYSAHAGGPNVPGFLYTTTSGLKRLTFDGSAFVFESLAANSWISASHVLWVPALDVAGQPSGPGLIGVKQDGRSFFIAVQNGAGFDTPVSTFSISPLVRSVELLNWDTDAALELAIHHSNGVHIREQGGAIRLARSAPVPGDAIAVVHKPGLSDALAWVTRLDGVTPSLILLNEDFATYQGPTPLDELASGTVVGSLASADLDGDGDDDLAYTCSGDFVVRIVYDDADTGSWTWEYTPDPEQQPPMTMQVPAFAQPDPYGTVEEWFPLGGSSSTGPGTAQLVCAPLFNERSPLSNEFVPDFALAYQHLDGLRIVNTLAQVPVVTTRDPMLVLTPHYFESAGYTPTFVSCASSLSKWWVTLGNSWGTQPATVVEVAVRRRVGGVTEPDPTPLYHFYHDLAPAGIEGTTFGFPGDLDTVGPPVHTSESCFYASVRPVELSSTGTVLSAGAWKVLGLSANSATNDPMRDLATARGSFVLANANVPTLDAPDGCAYYSPSVDVPGWNDCGDPEGGMHIVGGKSIPSAVYQTRVPSLVPPGVPNTTPGAPPVNP